MDKAQSVPTPPPAAAAPDRAEAERASVLLGRLAAMAMEQAEVMHQAVLAAARAEDTTKVKEFGLAFDRATRGLRQTLAIEAHLGRQRREAASKAAAETRGRAEEKTQRRRQVARAVACSLGGDHSLDTGRAEACASELWERLIADPEIDAALALAEHPLEEIVLHLCRDMGIHPDPAWLDPEYSGADWGLSGRPGAMDRGAEGAPDPAGPPWWPLSGPNEGRYWYLRPTAENSTIVTGWHDLDTQERLDRPPWELKPDDG